jgi:glycosyltransferase involved in cell wall biosynthesis
MSILYISYDGMMEPLGQSQVLAYLRQLVVYSPIHLISFEKSEDLADIAEFDFLAREIEASGIVWHPLRYHKRPTALATTWDIANGMRLGIWLVLRHRLKIVHARSYVSSMMALAIKRITGVKYLFDMRGFWADEKLDGGWSPEDTLFRLAKHFEKRFLLSADHVVLLTRAAVGLMQQFTCLQDRMPPVSVIPTCADLSRFKPLPRESVGFTMGYVGTAGNWYLFDKTAECFAELLRIRPDTKFLLVNRGEHAFIRDRLAAAGVPSRAVELIAAAPAEMPRLISRMDASIFFIKPVFSKQASAATKLAELLGCGVPCMSNAGVGDMAEILEGERVGVALKDFDRTTMLAGLDQLLALAADRSASARCVEVAHKYFSLDEGVKRYRGIYERLYEIKN